MQVATLSDQLDKPLNSVMNVDEWFEDYNKQDERNSSGSIILSGMYKYMFISTILALLEQTNKIEVLFLFEKFTILRF